MRRRLYLFWCLALLAFAGLATCGDIERDNPFDPNSGGEAFLRQQIIGEWERDVDGENQVYIFKSDGGVEWRSYSSPAGGIVDRNAPFPQTRVITFLGTWTLEGKTLALRFTTPLTNDPEAPPPSLPTGDLLVEAEVRRDFLTLRDQDGARQFSRLF